MDLHLLGDLLQDQLLVAGEGQLFQNQVVPLHQLPGGEGHRQAGGLPVVLDEVADRVEAPVEGPAVVVLAAEVLAERPLLVFRHVDGVVHQLRHALVFRRGDGHHRHPQHGLHAVDVDGPPVAPELVHHVQGHHHGHVHLQKLHGQIQVPLEVGGVHDVDDGPGLFLQDEVPGDQLLAGIGGHGVDPRQVGDSGVGPAPDDPVLPVHGDPGEVAHVLAGPGELVEEGGLAAVLVAHQGEGQGGPLGELLPLAGLVVLAPLPQAGVVGGLRGLRRRGREGLPRRQGLDGDLLPVGPAEGQLVAVEADLHGVPQGGQLHQGDRRPGDDPHIQQMLPQGALAPHGGDPPALADGQVFYRHVLSPSPMAKVRFR